MPTKRSDLLSRSIERKLLWLEDVGRQLGQAKDLLEESRKGLRSLEKLVVKHEREITAKEDGKPKEEEEVNESVGDAEMTGEVEREEIEERLRKLMLHLTAIGHGQRPSENLGLEDDSRNP